jgi:hypothetical protein
MQKQPQEAAAAAASPRLDDIVLSRGFGPLFGVYFKTGAN